MNEELAKSIYDSNGGSAMFGDYQAYLTALNSNPKYVSHIYNKYGSKNFGSQSEFEGSLKKKRTYATRVWEWFKSNPTIKWFATFPR